MHPPRGANSPIYKVSNQRTRSYFSLTLHGKGYHPSAGFRPQDGVEPLQLRNYWGHQGLHDLPPRTRQAPLSRITTASAARQIRLTRLMASPRRITVPRSTLVTGAPLPAATASRTR